MKKVYLLALLCCSVFTSIWAQTAIPTSDRPTTQLTPAQLQHFHLLKSAGNRALIGIAVDYDLYDEAIVTTNGGDYFSYVWRLHTNLPEVANFNTTLRYGAVLFDTLVDANTGTSYTNVPYKMDSLKIYFTHTRSASSTRPDSIRVKVYSTNTSGAPISLDANNNIANTVLYDTTYITSTSLSTPTTLAVLRFRPNLNFAANADFITSVEFRGDTINKFNILAGYGEYCGDACAAYPSNIEDNSFYFMRYVQGATNYSGINILYADCNANQTLDVASCEAYYIQNFAITPFVTVNTGSTTSCPSPATGTAGFRPDYNTLNCINQSTAYNGQVTFEVPTSINLPPTVTVNSIKIDSIRNLPCGITYSLDRVNATYNGGETGCVTFSGTTTAATGPYKLRIYATVNTSFGTQSLEISSFSGFEYYLRVITNGATTCATVASGTTGNTGGCTTSTPVATAPTATNATICRGASTTLNANATGGTGTYTYAWSASTGAAPANTANPSVSPTVTTTYTVTVTSGTATATGTVTVTVNVAPSATITGNTTFCAGGSTTLSAPAGLTYQWSANAGNSTNQTVTVNQAGTYSVTTTQNGCTATSSVNVTQGNPVATITPSGPTTFCTGGSVTLSAPAGFTYTWSANAGNSTNQSVTVNQTGSYSVTVSAGAGCTATSSVSVTVNSAPSATITPSGPTTFCSGGSVTLSAPAGLTYAWSANANSATTQTVNVTQSGTYSVTTTQNGCTATSSVNVTVNSAPSATITPNGATTFCTGGNVTLSAPAGLTYTWSANAGNSTSQSVNATAAGTYSVTVSNGSCTATSSVTVSVVSSPSATITAVGGSSTICSGSSLTLSAPSGYNYTWSANAGNATTQTVSVTAGGTYSVTVSAGASCTATSSITVTVNTPPTVTITPSGPTTFCTGGSVTLTSSSGQSYLWSNGTTNSSLLASQGGTYSVTVTSANGCTGTASQTVTVVSTPSATITPNGPTTVCPGTSVTLTAPSGFTYAWSNGSTSDNISVTLPGTYSVTVSAGASCTATSSVTIANNAAPSAVVTPAGPVTICAGDNVTLSAPAGLTYQWSNGSNSQTISPTLAGSYTVTVTNANNCTAVSTPVVVTAANPPATPVATFSNGTLSTNASATGYQWLLNGNVVATTQSYTPTQNGTYTVVITDANGCSSQSANVVVTGVGIFTVVNNLVVTINPNPSTGMFFISTGSHTGTFTLTVLDMAGREVMTNTVEGQLQQYPLDLSLVGDGVYIVRLSSGNAVSHSRVVVY